MIGRIRRIIFALLTIYISWMAMMEIHECGHALAAWIGGGHVERIEMPLFGFSRTDVAPNPSPRLEVWGGPIVGSVAPLLIWLLLRKKLVRPWSTALGFYTGLCLVANGVYLGVGWIMTAGDAAVLIKLGTPRLALIGFGLPATVLGFYIWHTLGTVRQETQSPP